jgi:hypothetical protein
MGFIDGDVVGGVETVVGGSGVVVDDVGRLAGGFS